MCSFDCFFLCLLFFYVLLLRETLCSSIQVFESNEGKLSKKKKKKNCMTVFKNHLELFNILQFFKINVCLKYNFAKLGTLINPMIGSLIGEEEERYNELYYLIKCCYKAFLK